MAGASLTPRESYVRAQAVPPFALNSRGTHLTRDGVLVRRTPTGFICLGMGSGALAMHAAFAGEDQTSLANLNVGKRDPAVPLGLDDDPGLRRLALLEALLKDGYDPNQPRDERGQWTDGGASVASAGSTSDVAFPTAARRIDTAVASGAAAGARTAIAVAERVPPIVEGGFQIGGAAAIAGIGAFVATMLTPANLSALHEGTIAGQPDINYRYAEGELTLWRQKPDGSRQMLYSGVPGLDGIYRDEEGHVVGRSAGNTFAVDGAVLPALSAKANSKPKPHLDAKARSLADTSEPEVCPEPGPDWPGSRLEDAMAYQRQIARLPDGPDGRPMVAWYHGVAYDGCDLVTGNLLEAKEGGYGIFLDRNGKVKRWAKNSKRALNEAMQQMSNQSRAAPGRTIEWHFSEPAAAAFFSAYATRMNLKNIRVVHTPAIRG